MRRNPDLGRALREASGARERLTGVVTRLDDDALAAARPGGWSVLRVLQHVVESESVYVRLLSHIQGTEIAALPARELNDARSVTHALSAAREAVLAAVADIDDATLYRLVRFGHEEYSVLSILENIAHHDDEHREQIEAIVSRPRHRGGARVSPAGLTVRHATQADLPRITEIYNYYVRETPITFDLEPWAVEARRPWFEQFHESGRHQLFVAERAASVVGYACSHQFRTKAAYDTTVETTIYCAPEATGGGIGSALYERVFDALAAGDVRMAIAGITLPNAASVALHERMGFVPAGVMHGVGRKFGRYWDVGWYEKRLR